MAPHVNRREFIKCSALAAAGQFAGGSASGQTRSPNDRLNIGIIGVNSRGAANMKAVSSENIVALCDVNESFLAETAKRYPQAKTYADWRRLLDQKDIDAVVISTTEHTHAPASIWAMQRGKHVYCEKPLAHTVHEARLVRETYKKSKVATQMGTQIHATDNYRRVVELIQSGAIGPVREAHAWVEQGIVGPRSRPAEEQPAPKDLNWDLWLGPAPVRPYHSCYFEKRSITWQNWWDFGNGALGDMGSHIIDLPFWALDLKYPTTVETQGPFSPREETYPDCLKVEWEHPARGQRPPVKLVWYDGRQWPDSPEGVDLKKWHLGVKFVGDNGILVANYGKWMLLPEAKFRDFKPPEPTIAKSPGHHLEWIQACKTGSPTLCNFDYSGALVENNLLGTVSFRLGKKLDWDAENLKATNCPEADKFIRKSYREGWTLEDGRGA